jgi:CheY-like chemotaxis protein
MACILLIEDNEASLELMRYLLEAFGHSVQSVPNGKRGLEVAQSKRPDLIICDIHLPEMDGYTIAQHLKSDAELRSILLMAVSALAMVGDQDKGLAAGFDSYVAKPIDPQGFIQQVECVLQAIPRGPSPPMTKT